MERGTGWLAALAALAAAGASAEDRLILKDGMTLSGTLDLSGGVALVKQRHRVYHVAKSLLLKPEEDAAPAEPEPFFRVPQPRPEKPPKGVPPIAGYAAAKPFDEFGRRSVTFLDPAGKQSKQIQLIRTLYPTHAETDLLDAALKSTSPLSEIVPGGLPKLLRKCVDGKSAEARERVVKFLLLAKRFAEADAELAALAKDFPGEESRTRNLQAARNRAVAALALAKARLWAASGQFARVQGLEAELLPLADEEQRRKYETLKGQALAAGANVEALRKALRAAKLPPALPEADRQAATAALEEIATRLTPANAARLQAFEAFAHQPNAKPGEAAALALSGWRVGAALARTDFAEALHWWRCGASLAAALASGDTELPTHLAALARPPAEGKRPLAVELLARMAPLLPAPPTELPPGLPSKVEAADARVGPVPYLVQLPREYDPDRSYPVLVALPGKGDTAERYAKLWGADATDHGVLLAIPEPAAEPAEYGFTLEEHLRLAAVLRDVRRRFAADADRMVLAGHGSGGVAAWDYASAHPDEFAGLAVFQAPPQRYAERHYHQNLAAVPVFAAMGGLDNLGTLAMHRHFAEFAKLDQPFLHVVYPSRGGGLSGELDTLFDWLVRRRREAYPHQFAATSARPGDRDFHWVRIDSHRARTTVPPELFGRSAVTPAKLSGTATDANALLVKATGIEGLTIRIGPGLAAHDDPGLTVKVNGKTVHQGKLEADLDLLVRELRRTGDRRRLVLAELPVGRVP